MSDKSSSHPDFPDGLVTAFITWRLRTRDVELAQLLAAVGRMPGGRAGKNTARVVLKGDKSYHVHFEISRDGTRHIWVELELVRGAAREEEAESIQRMFEAIAAHMRESEPRDTFDGLAGATYELDLTKWEPTVKLPFGMPGGGLAPIPGAPAIVGVDVEFQETPPQVPIRRAFVSTFPSAEMLVVRFMLDLETKLDESVLPRLVGEAKTYLPWFARRRMKEVES
ncbi:MAG TPA: hypothetical protein VIV88_18765 [Gemmatimonadales bacterium]|jgi:hypothetical protein